MFRYKLEPLLKYRKTLEDERQRSLAEANRHYFAELGRAKEIESERSNVLNRMKEAMKTISDPETLKLYDNYLAGSDINIDAINEKVETVKQIVDIERETLVECVKNRKIIETHRKRMEERYIRDESRRERQMYDEVAITMYMYKEKSGENI